MSISRPTVSACVHGVSTGCPPAGKRSRSAARADPRRLPQGRRGMPAAPRGCPPLASACLPALHIDGLAPGSRAGCGGPVSVPITPRAEGASLCPGSSTQCCTAQVALLKVARTGAWDVETSVGLGPGQSLQRTLTTARTREGGNWYGTEGRLVMTCATVCVPWGGGAGDGEPAIIRSRSLPR